MLPFFAAKRSPKENAYPFCPLISTLLTNTIATQLPTFKLQAQPSAAMLLLLLVLMLLVPLLLLLPPPLLAKAGLSCRCSRGDVAPMLYLMLLWPPAFSGWQIDSATESCCCCCCCSALLLLLLLVCAQCAYWLPAVAKEIEAR
jgi:hypothetical protein